jgi:hypothetical protein
MVSFGRLSDDDWGGLYEYQLDCVDIESTGYDSIRLV